MREGSIGLGNKGGSKGYFGNCLKGLQVEGGWGGE